MIACAATTHVAFAFLQTSMVYANSLAVITTEKYFDFAILSSRFHESWARYFGSSLGDGLRYTPSDCFQTFPFPQETEELETIGKEYYEYRAELMVRNNQGLTDTYNRFHDPYEIDKEIVKLRELHGQMDRAVLRAYGWSDIDSTCGYGLDYLETDKEDLPEEVQERIDSGDLYFADAYDAREFNIILGETKRKLPWRYRWPQAVHDEVLARLIALNQTRYEEEEKGNKKPKKT